MGRQKERGQPQPEQTEAQRETALRDALRAALRKVDHDTFGSSRDVGHGSSQDRERQRWLSKELSAQQLEFMQGITATASLLGQARDMNGDPIYPTDARYSLLAALGRMGGWPLISELARCLRVSKQAAREQVVAAARAGLLELLPDPHDRRAIQVGLTPGGKRLLAATSARQFSLVARLLNGLEGRDMRRVSHVLRVIRERLLASHERLPSPERDG